MKKFVKALAVALTAFVVVSLTGCQNGASLINEINLEAPELTVKAFPGYNYVAWLPVEGAASVVVYRNDGTKVSGGTDNNNGGSYIDTSIKNGAEYKYTAYAFKKSDRSLDVTTPGATTQMGNWDEVILKQSGSKTSASVKAVVPVNGTKALDLIDYEGGDQSKFKLNKDNINVELINNEMWVSFPTKAYLKYTVNFYKGNELETFDTIVSDVVAANTYSSSTTYDKNFYTVDGNYAKKLASTAAGEYTVTVKVASLLGSDYPESEVITASKKVTIKGLDVTTATSGPVVQYKDKDTIRVLWSPAKNHNNEAYPASKYSVYYSNTFTNYWKDVSSVTVKVAKVNEDGSAVTDKEGNPVYDEKLESLIKANKAFNQDVYYIDFDLTKDKVSNEITNTFRVVLKDKDADGTPLYEAYKENSVGSFITNATGATLSAVNTALEDMDLDGMKNDLLVKVEAPNKSTTISAVKYAFVDSTSKVLMEEEYTNALTVVDATGTNFFVIKDIPVGKYVALYAATTEEGKATAYALRTYTSTPSVSALGDATQTVSVAFTDVDEDKDLTSKDVYFKVTGLKEGQTVVNAKYAVSKVSSGVATSLLYSDKAVKAPAFTTIDGLSGTTYSATAYSYIKDVAKDSYVALYVEIAEAGQLNKKATAVSTKATLPAAYDSNLNPTVTVSYIAADDDGLANDAIIYVKPDADTKLTSVKYVANIDSTACDILLSTDAAKALTIPTAEQTAYTWVVKDVAKESYVAVYAKTEKDVNFGFKTAKTAGTAASAAKGYNTGMFDNIPGYDKTNLLKINYVALGEDKIANDALIQVKLPEVSYDSATGKYLNADKKLAEVKYVTTKVNSTDLLYTPEAKPLTIPTTTATTEPRTFYYFVVENVPEGNYTFAYAKFTEKNEYCEATANTTGTVSYKAAATAAVVELEKVAQDADKVVNDVRVDIDLKNKDNKLKSILYVVVDEKTVGAEIANASDLLKSTDVKALPVVANTYTYYIKDVKANAKVYVMAEVECKDKVNTFSTVYNTTMDDLTAPSAVKLNGTPVVLTNAAGKKLRENDGTTSFMVAADADGKLNDLSFNLQLNLTQTASVVYVTADKAVLLDNQLYANLGKPVAVKGTPEDLKDDLAKPDLVTGKKYTYELKDVPAKQYVAIVITVKEAGKDDFVYTLKTSNAAAE
ncbi:MAG: hypothetical protein MJ182_01335 [Treponema sp.]|nr:hypothetical protein [Treponema sp.]